MTRVGKRFRALLPAFFIVAAFGVSAPPASAEDGPGDNAAVAQYVELIPTSVGPRAPGITKRARTPLAPALAQRVREEGGHDAPLLEEVATSTTYGAPQRALPLSPKRGDAGGTTDTNEVSAQLAGIEPAFAPASRRLAGLLAVMAAVAIATLAFAFSKRPR